MYRNAETAIEKSSSSPKNEFSKTRIWQVWKMVHGFKKMVMVRYKTPSSNEALRLESGCDAT